VEEFEALWHHLRRHARNTCEVSTGPSEIFYMQERVARVDDERCGLHGLGGASRCPRAHGEYNVDWNLYEIGGQPRYPIVLAICKSLLDDEILPLRVAQFSKVSPENIEMRASGTRGTDLQPTDALYPGSFLRLERGRYSEQTYAKTKNNRRADPRDEISPSHCLLPWPGGVAAANLCCRMCPQASLTLYGRAASYKRIDFNCRTSNVRFGPSADISHRGEDFRANYSYRPRK
jgi:hypothetical protein